MATVTLGRDGMGANATNADFESWVAFVALRIDAACGFKVSVYEQGRRDVRDDEFTGDDAAQETMREAVAALWNQWCAGVDSPSDESAIAEALADIDRGETVTMTADALESAMATGKWPDGLKV